MRPLIVLILSSVFIIASCKKDAAIQSSPAQPTSDNSKSFLKDVKSDNQADFYISGNFDGYNIYCASTMGQYYPSNDTIMNVAYINNAIGEDDIHLLRENNEMSVTIAIYLEQTNIYSRQLPYTLPHPDLGICECAQMEFINMKKLGTVTQCSVNDDFTFLGHTNTNIKLT